MDEVEWRRLRADQLRERARQDAVVIVPVAALEQHGPHLPVEVDTLLGEGVALRTARKAAAMATPALVLPVLWTGISEHHMSFGGTVTLDFAAFSALVEGVVRSVLRHGFRRIVLLNAHGGNENALRTITDDLTPKLGVPIVQFTYWYAAAVAIAKILETQGGLQHACEAETSMMMAVRPELVATDRIPLAKSNASPRCRRRGWRRRLSLAHDRQPFRLRRDRQSRSGQRGERRTVVRSDLRLAGEEAMQCRAVAVAMAIGADGMSIELTVNGKDVAIRAGETTPLLDVLRNELDAEGLALRLRTGTMRQLHGAGGRRTGLCLLARGRHGRRAARRSRSKASAARIRLQQAFLEEQAGQCAYCLSGIIMSAKALLDRNPAPTRDDIVAALDKHLCRCGAHPRILRAVEKAAAALREGVSQ